MRSSGTRLRHHDLLYGMARTGVIKATWGASAPGNLLFNVVMVVKKKEIAVWGKNAYLHRAADALEVNTLTAGL